MSYAIPSWDLPSVPVSGSEDRFPVRRIYCIGRNYAAHAREMGADERSMLVELTERCRKQKEPLRVKANWVGRISQSKNDGTKLEKIAHLSFDWKLWSIQAFS